MHVKLKKKRISPLLGFKDRNQKKEEFD